MVVKMAPTASVPQQEEEEENELHSLSIGNNPLTGAIHCPSHCTLRSLRSQWLNQRQHR